MTINKSLFTSNINDYVAGKLQSKVPASSKNIYTSQDPYFDGIGAFVRNPLCWLNGVQNISCFSPAQLSGSSWQQRGGTLITRKHVLFAKHFYPSIISGGTPLIFVDDSNNVVRRNIVEYQHHPYTDISIALLDSEVPQSISFAKVLPKSFSNYIDINFENPIYCIGLDQQEYALVKVFSHVGTYSQGGFTYKRFEVNESHAGHGFQNFNETIISGDSGNPVFVLIDNQLVVVTTWHYPTGGPFISDSDTYDYVNSMIETLSPQGGYALTDINLASAYENMMKVYFNPTANDNYGEITNWYQDQQLTVPAVSLPSASDRPVMPWTRSLQRMVCGSALGIP